MEVVDVHVRELDPSGSPLDYYGYELRRAREAAGARWRKSSYSGGTGGDCVEVAGLTGHIAVRDSKNPGGGVVVVGPRAFVAFLRGATR